MLIISFGLLVLDTIKPVEIKDLAINLGFGIVTFEANRSTDVAKEILVHHRDVRFRLKGISGQELGVHTTKELKHLDTPMSGDTVVMGRGLTENGIGREPFRKATHIGSGETQAEMLAKGVMNRGAVILSGGIKSGLDSLIGHPHKMWFEEVKVGKTGRTV